MRAAPKVRYTPPSIEILDITATSLDAAREGLKSKIKPDRQILVCEEVISDGKPLMLEGFAESIEQAFDSCQKRVPAEASVTERLTRFEPAERILAVKARDEESARQAATSTMNSSSVITDVRLVEHGRKGFLGIGRTDSMYEVRVRQRAVVTLRAETKAHVRWTLQSSDPENDVDRAGLIQWLERCACWFAPFAQKRGSALRPYIPGNPTFICAQERCTNTCCKFSRDHLVVVWGELADAIKAKQGLDYKDFVDQYPGFHALKMREQKKCVFVDDCNRCRIYDLRPPQCVSYPFELAFFRLKPNGSFSLENTTDVYRRSEMAREPLAFYKAGSAYDFLIPMIVYDSGCPGFTGPPISAEDYLKTVSEIFEQCRATNATVRYL